MMGLSLNKLSEPSQVVINNISDHLCVLYRGVAASQPIFPHLGAAQTVDSGALTVNILGRVQPEHSEEEEVPRTDRDIMIKTDFASADTQPKLSLPGSPCPGVVVPRNHLTKTCSQISGLHVQTCPCCPNPWESGTQEQHAGLPG